MPISLRTRFLLLYISSIVLSDIIVTSYLHATFPFNPVQMISLFWMLQVAFLIIGTANTMLTYRRFVRIEWFVNELVSGREAGPDEIAHCEAEMTNLPLLSFLYMVAQFFIGTLFIGPAMYFIVETPIEAVLPGMMFGILAGFFCALLMYYGTSSILDTHWAAFMRHVPQDRMASRQMRFPIVVKVVCAVGLVILITLCFTVIPAYFEARTALVKSHIDQGRNRVETIFTVLRFMGAQDEEALSEFLSVLPLGAQGRIWLLDRDGRIVASGGGREGKLASLAPPLLEGIGIHRSEIEAGRVHDTSIDYQVGDLDRRRLFDEQWYAYGVEPRTQMLVLVELSKKDLGDTLSWLRWKLFFFALAITAITGIVIYPMSRNFSIPLNRLLRGADAISKGDLTKDVEVSGGDEIGDLAKAFQKMTAALRDTLIRIGEAMARVKRAGDEIESVTTDLIGGASRQQEQIGEVSRSAQRVDRQIQQIGGYVDNLVEVANENSSAVTELLSSITEIDRTMNNVTGTTEETSAAMLQMTESIRQVERMMENLNALAERSVETLDSLMRSMMAIEGISSQSVDLSRKVGTRANEGGEAVSETIEHMDVIRQHFDRSRELVRQLREKSEEIGSINEVILNVAERTNLLALNASIIATRAGEHGSGFSVVANQIKALATQTAGSTKSIETLIDEFQDRIEQVGCSMEDGAETVARGVSLSKRSGDKLREILESTGQSTTMSEEISEATRRQSQEIKSVTQANNEVVEMVRQVLRATKEQTLGGGTIGKASEQVKTMVEQVKRAVSEQSKSTETVAESIEHVRSMMEEMRRLAGCQAEESRSILSAVEQIEQIVDTNVDRVKSLALSRDQMLERTQVLAAIVERFRWNGSEGSRDEHEIALFEDPSESRPDVGASPRVTPDEPRGGEG